MSANENRRSRYPHGSRSRFFFFFFKGSSSLSKTRAETDRRIRTNTLKKITPLRVPGSCANCPAPPAACARRSPSGFRRRVRKWAPGRLATRDTSTPCAARSTRTTATLGASPCAGGRGARGRACAWTYARRARTDSGPRRSGHACVGARGRTYAWTYAWGGE